MKVVVDCANGAGYRAAPDVLFELGAEVIPIATTLMVLILTKIAGAVFPAPWLMRW